MNEVRKPERHNLGQMLGLSSMFSFIFCLMASQELADMPIFGGALYMCSQVATIFFTTYAGSERWYLPSAQRRWRTALLILLMVLNLSVVVIFPIQLESATLWMLFATVISMTVRDGLVLRLIHSAASRSIKPRWQLVTLLSLHILPMLVMLWVFLYNLSATRSWLLFGGYAVSDLLSLYSQMAEIKRVHHQSLEPIPTKEELTHLQEVLKGVHSYRVYSVLSALVLIAIAMTTVLIYTYLAATPEQMLYHMLIAMSVTTLSYEMIELWFKRTQRKHLSDPTNVMLVGLFLWFFALNTFRLQMQAPILINVFICLGLCTAGATLCLSALARMEQGMVRVARFAAGDQLKGYRRIRQAELDLAVLLGQMLALAALTLICFRHGKNLPRDAEELSSSFQPLLVIPALLTVLGALVFTFRFPLSSRTLDKLSRFLHMQKEGNENSALESQLHRKVIEKHRQPFFIKTLKFIVRILYRHKMIGTAHVHPDDANPIVFLCNHGDIYGPVASVSHIPYPIRPWSIDKVCSNVQEVQAYIYKYDWENNEHVPRILRKPIAWVIAHVSVWCMNYQLESIPVYRDQPSKLMRTFRASVEALQAGDNLLIFPENPNAVYQDHGYETEGVGELFSGFAMLATIYYKRTGLRCRFQPMFCNKRTRVIAFGEEIVYDPDRDPHEETERIVSSAEKQMKDLAQLTGSIHWYHVKKST